MFRFLTRTMRRRAGLTLAVLYLACTIGPSLAWAFSDGTAAARCLSDDHHHRAAAKAHVHDDGSTHHHAGHDQAPAQADHDSHDGTPANCCGLFCVSAAADDVSLPIGVVAPRGCTVQPTLQAALGGLEPPRIDRPPSILMSF